MKLIAIALLAAACGASSTQNPNSNSPGPNMECHDETSSTSSVPRQVCRPKAAATNADGTPALQPQQAPPPPQSNH